MQGFEEPIERAIIDLPTIDIVECKDCVKHKQLSVAKDIEALALINIQDIFRFTITATDEEIEDRYGSEARAIEIAEKYLEIAMRTSVMEYDLKGWSMKYSVPIKGKDERIEKTAYFYDMADRKTENSSENRTSQTERSE